MIAEGVLAGMGLDSGGRALADRRRSASICAKARSERAVIVNSGLTPKERGMIEQSMT